MRRLADMPRPQGRIWGYWTAASLALAALAGCEAPPPPSPAELGRVVFDPDAAPGGQKRFELPDLKPREAAADADASHDAAPAGHDHAK